MNRSELGIYSGTYILKREGTLEETNGAVCQAQCFRACIFRGGKGSDDS